MRKSLAAALMILALLALCAFSAAESSGQPEHIQFMGMDWLITPDEFGEGLREKGIDYNDVMTWRYTRWSSLDGFISGYIDDPQIPHKPLEYAKKDSRGNGEILTQIAGYEVASIEAYFLPTFDSESLYIGEPYKLFKARIRIYSGAVKNARMTISSAYTDLNTKLKNLYGEPKYDGKAYSYWVAKDGTAIYLEIREFSNGTEYIDIRYGINNDVDYVNAIIEIQKKLKQQDPNDISNQYNGL